MLGISVGTLDYLISQKKIRAQKIAKRVLIHNYQVPSKVPVTFKVPSSEGKTSHVDPRSWQLPSAQRSATELPSERAETSWHEDEHAA
jgi:hypothetical protein